MSLVSNRAGAEAPPLQPTTQDVVFLNVAQGAELAAKDLYNDALGFVTFSKDQTDVLQLFRDRHVTYAQALNGLLSKSNANLRNEGLYSTYAKSVSSAADALSALQTVENTLVATHTEIIGFLVGLNGANLLASMLIVEARHAAVFGSTPTIDITSALTSDATSLIATKKVTG